MPIPLRHLEVVLPIGISFYTFQSMSYVIDVYRREIKPTRNLVQFAAVRIVLSASGRRTDHEGDDALAPGCLAAAVPPAAVLRGRLSDLLGPGRESCRGRQPGDSIVNDLFGRWQTLDGGLALLAVYAFAFQIYGDFSGYTNMARGVAKCLGFELPLNFNLPYFATSPRDFWNRWHISLSQWLRDYLYIPLGGSRRGTLARPIAT